MYICLKVQYPLYLSGFNETWTFSADFRKILKFSRKSVSGSHCVPCGRAGGHDMTWSQCSLFAILGTRLKVPIHVRVWLASPPRGAWLESQARIYICTHTHTHTHNNNRPKSSSWHSTHGRVWLIGTRAQPESLARLYVYGHLKGYYCATSQVPSQGMWSQ
jgi:hypothetical protein